MLKPTLKYLILFCILLFAGSSKSSAGSYPDFHCHAPIHFADHLARYSFNFNSERKLLFSTDAGGYDKSFRALVSEENNEESYEADFQEVWSASGNYFTAFYGKVLHAQIGRLAPGSGYQSHWFYASSSRSIILRVIRI